MLTKSNLHNVYIMSTLHDVLTEEIHALSGMMYERLTTNSDAGNCGKYDI